MKGKLRSVAGGAVLSMGFAAVLMHAGTSFADSFQLDPHISYPVGQEAANVGNQIPFSGAIDEQAEIDSARIQFTAPDGSPGESFDVRSLLSKSGNGLAGVFTILSDICTTEDCDQHDYTFVLIVHAHKGADQQEATSNVLTMDIRKPIFTRTALIAPDKVKVTVSEPVVLKAPLGESPVDWTVDGNQPLSVAAPSETVRILTLLSGKDQDATPEVRYVSSETPTRAPYIDKAANALTSRHRISTAADEIPPAIPTITGIAGKAGKNVTANDPDPTVTFTGLRAGHVAQVFVESNDEAGFQLGGDRFLGEAAATASGATVQADALAFAPTPGTTFTLYGVTRDRAACQASEGSHQSAHLILTGTECPNHSGVDAASYTLDTIAPAPQFAVAEGGNGIRIQFDEALDEGVSDNPAAWTVTPPAGPVLAVHQLGESIFLDLSGPPAPPTTLVSYNGDVGQQRDIAGNKVASIQPTSVLNGIPPVVEITAPVGSGFTRDGAVTISGTAVEADKVELYRGGTCPNGIPERTRDVSGGAFLFEGVPLNNGPNMLQVLGVKTGPPRFPGQFCASVSVTRDANPPVVSVTAPDSGDVVAGGAAIDIEWSASDPENHLLEHPISIEYSDQAGAEGSWQPVTEENLENSGSFTWTPPSISSTSAVFRVIAEDQAGPPVGIGQSGIFEIDAVPPQFTATTKNRSTIEVNFSELVTGDTQELEWEIDGVPPASVDTISVTTPKGERVAGVVLTTLPTHPLGKNSTPKTGYAPRPVLSSEFEDKAGNTIVERLVTTLDGIAPDLPTVTEPSGAVMTGDETYTIKGTAEAGSLVSAYHDENRDDEPDGTAVGSKQLGASQTGYQVVAGLASGKNNLVITASDPAGNQSEAATVPSISRDAEAPFITVLEPEEGQTFGAGTPLHIGWLAVDDNLLADSIKIELSTDGGETFTMLAENEANDGEFVTTLPDEATEEAEVRISAVDELGLEGVGTSGAFRTVVCDIVGTDGNDVLVGTAAGETICTLDGEDSVEAGSGDDLVLSGAGAKTIDGGDGNDLIEGGAASDDLDGAAGDDIVHGRGGDDLVKGGEGADAIFGELGNDRGLGSSGDDRVSGGDGDDALDGEAGDDDVRGGPGADRLTGGFGNDLLSGNEGPDALSGGEGDDNLSGSEGDDRLDGGAGNDALSGDDGTDVLIGAAGADTATGGGGDDTAIGGTGKDTLKGGDGADTLLGSNGPDLLFGHAGDDVLKGGNGRDLLNGGADEDSCLGGTGKNTLKRC